jgi:hypothetical protein
MRRGSLAGTMACAACVWACSLSAGATTVIADSAPLPTYDGFLTFPVIHDASDPEEFSWEVLLGKDQELRQVNNQRAEVVYPDETVAASIVAEAAHDVTGAAVPTSLSVSEGDIVTLFVHHRAGNPATGAPFDYPITAGEGWEGGFETTFVRMPPPEPPVEAPRAEDPPSRPRRGDIGGPPVFKLGPPDEGRRTSPALVFGTGQTVGGPVQLVAYGWEAEADSPPADFCIWIENTRHRYAEFGTCGVPLGKTRPGPVAIDMDVQTVAPRSARATAVGGRISPKVAAVRLYFRRPGSKKRFHVTAIVGQVDGDLQRRLKQPAPFGFFYAKVRGALRFGAFHAQALDAGGNVIGAKHGLTPQY